MDFTSGEIRGFVNAVRGDSKSGECITRGTVTRVDPDGTAWVQIGQNAEPTPCQRDMACQSGDYVTVRIADHKATVTGNASSPATDDKKANIAYTQATFAGENAMSALIAAKTAEGYATSAQNSAIRARAKAEEAKAEADAAHDAADDASTAATEANSAARSAVVGLGQVQDVIGTLDWIREHGTYALTEDTTVDPSKVYYTRSGTAPDYTYTPVAEPKDEELGTYYELSVDEAMAEFVGAHLALLSDGLHVVSDASGYYIVLSNDAMRVYDPQNRLVAKYGDYIELYQDGELAMLLDGDGMTLYDGIGTSEENVIAAFGERRATIGTEGSFHTAIDPTSMAIMNSDDRLVSVSSNGTAASIYMGASTAAAGCKYTNRRVISYVDKFNSGYVISTEPDARGRYPLIAPDGQVSEFFAEKSGSDVYRVKDPDGDDFTSGMYAGIYASEGFEDEFSLSIRLTPQDEVPGPVDIDGGDVSVHAEDGVATITGSIVGTNDITAQSDVSDGIGTLDQVRQDSKNASNITSGTLPIAHGGTGATTASNAVKALTGRAWDFNTNNTSDTWVPVATRVGGEGRWQHRAIPTNLATLPVTLWSGSTTANITLSQSAANFTRITIYYNDSDNQCSSVDIYSPNGKLVLLASSWDGRFNKMRSVRISGTSVSTVRAYQTDALGSGSEATNLIYITRVLGWKY